MKTILVPTDFSQEAESGVEYATALAQAAGYKIILLHAFHLTITDVLYTQIVPATDSFRTVAHDQLLMTRDLICARTSSPPECIFEEGALEDAIRKTVDERKIDLIIMGTRGAKGIKRLFSGSHTSAIIRQAGCPVISIPQNTEFKKYSRISFVTNYHRDDIEELGVLVDLACLYNSLITIIHAAKTGEDHNEELMTAFERNVRKQISYPHFSFKVLSGEAPQERLHKYLEDENPDLFALSTRKRLWIERLAGPGLSETLSLECTVPLLVFHQATPTLIF